MARRFIDGMAIVTSDQIGIDIEDVLYSDDAGTADCFSQEEFSVAQKAYETAQLIKTLALSEAYQELAKLASEESINARLQENNYDGVDSIRIATLRQRRIVADHTLDFVRNTVENAASVARPVLVREEDPSRRDW
jgi:ribosomal protein L4